MRVLALALLVTASAPVQAEYIDHLANPNDVGEAKVPRFGRSRILVIPVVVRAGGAGGAFDRDRLDRFYSDTSTTDLTFRSYFATQSNGRFAPEPVVSPTLYFDRCPDELGGSCSVDSTDLTDLKDSMDLVRTILNRADRGCWTSATQCEAQTGVEFDRFDVNGPRATADGWIDGLIIATTMTDVGVALPVYALNDGRDNLAGGLGGAFLVDGVKIPLVAIAAHRETPQYSSLHEFGHLLGLADLSQEPLWRETHPDLVYQGFAGSLMSTPAPENGEMLDAESRYRLGWADVEVVSGTKRLTLKPSSTGGAVVKLGMQQQDGRREYFLAEVRGPIGPYDLSFHDRAGVPVYGLAVTHVDWAKGPRGSFVGQLLNCVDCDPWHPFLRNVQADRRFDLQEGLPFAPEDDLFLPGDALVDARNTAPFGRDNKAWGSNWYDGTQSAIGIANLELDAERGWITADFTAPVVDNPCADLTCATGLTCVRGNCVAPSDTTVDPVKPLPRPAKTADDGWGCTATPAPALALLGLALRRRRATSSC